MDNLNDLLTGGVGTYMTYRAVRGFSYLLLGRPGYVMMCRNMRRQSVKWNALCRRDDVWGKAACALSAHKAAFSMNVQMVTPESVSSYGLRPLGRAGHKAFLVCIDIVPFCARKTFPCPYLKMVDWAHRRRIREQARKSLKRRVRRGVLPPAVLQKGR